MVATPRCIPDPPGLRTPSSPTKGNTMHIAYVTPQPTLYRVVHRVALHQPTVVSCWRSSPFLCISKPMTVCASAAPPSAIPAPCPARAQACTLKQTGKLRPDLPIVLFGKKYWEKVWVLLCWGDRRQWGRASPSAKMRVSGWQCSGRWPRPPQ